MFSRNLLIALAAFSFLYACDDQPQGDTAVVNEQQEVTGDTGSTTLRVDTTSSTITFQGNGVGKYHRGTFNISEGQLMVNNDQITGGRFLIDVRSLDMEEEGAMIDEKLRPHLLSNDFFAADSFPTATFEITSVVPFTSEAGDTSVIAGANYRVSGNLMLRDQVKNVTFPARIDVDENNVEAEADFDINRRDWNMVYGNDRSLGDKFISETVNIELDLKAERDGNTL